MSRLLSLLLVSLLSLAPARSQFVDLTSDIEIVSWGASLVDDPPMFVPNVWKVHCIVGTNSWLITATNNATFPETWFYTGSNLVHQFPKILRKDVVDGATNEIQITRTHTFDGDLDSSTDGPFLNSGPFRAAWLAYCSGPFLNRPGRQIPLLSTLWKESWLYSDFAAEPRGFRDKTAKFQDDFGSPISVELLSKSGHPLFQYRVKQDHGPVAASTKIYGWHFPTEFRAIQYHPVPGTKEGWQALVTARGTVTSLKLGTPPDLSLNATPQSRRGAKLDQSYVLKAGGPSSVTVITNSPGLNKARVFLSRRQSTPSRISFTVTNAESEEILLWNVRVQIKSHGENPGTDGFGWDTVSDDYPQSGEAVLKPAKSTELTVIEPSAPLWRVCVLYAKKPTDSAGREIYNGNYEICSEAINEARLDELDTRQ
jgi:hypothetical protein